MTAAREVYERIKCSRDLPSPTGIALRLLELTQDESVSISEITPLIESDPAISSRLIQIANSPLAGLSRQIGSVSRAVALLGLRTVTALALGFSLVTNHRSGKCVGFDYPGFWSESLAKATTARSLASRTKGFAPDEAFTCGLLSRIGRLAMATACYEQYAMVLQSAAGESGQRLLTLEQETFEIDHNQMTCEMMTDWRIPELFRQAVIMQDLSEEELVAISSRESRLACFLSFGELMSVVLTRPVVFRDDLASLVVRANRLGVSPAVYHEVFDCISAEWRNAAAVFSVNSRKIPPLAELYAVARQRQASLQEEPLTSSASDCTSEPGLAVR